MSIKKRFEELVIQWDKETLFSSDPSTDHPAHKEIVYNIGWAAVPWLLEIMEGPSNHWFWALSAITKQEPDKPGDAGNIRAICDAWRRWGKEHSILISLLKGLEPLNRYSSPPFVELYMADDVYEHEHFAIDTHLGTGQELYVEGDEYGYLFASIHETVERTETAEASTIEELLILLKGLSNS